MRSSAPRAERFVATGLELGGKDPAYVRADAPLEATVENLVDGAFFNSGQSCCAIERIYVHADVYDEFVEGYVELTSRYRLGDPLQPATTLGPMVRADAAENVRDSDQRSGVQRARAALIDPKRFPADARGTPYLAPQVLVERRSPHAHHDGRDIRSGCRDHARAGRSTKRSRS